MKKRLSISIEDSAIEKLDKLLKTTNGKFRNRSHALEHAIDLLIGEIQNE